MAFAIKALISKALQIKCVPIRYYARRGIHHYHCSNDFTGPVNASYNHYLQLPIPKNKFLATYVWIDGTGIKLRSKDRVLDKEPCDLKALPKWSFDGSSTGQAKTDDSDTLLIPVAMYQDPFRKSPHVIVLCETMHGDGTPTLTNHRAECAKILSNISDQDPWFGIEQEYTMFNEENWPLGWPGPRGYPVLKNKFSYCGVGKHVAGRVIVECHARASLYSGMDYGGSNAEVMMGSWEFQVGTTPGIKAADDLWIGRYLLERIAESFGVTISYHPKPMGMDQPGIGCHHNFSVKKMRNDGGIAEIERVCKVLCENHEKDMVHYGLGDSDANKKRLSGKFETSSFNTCKWGIADRTASIRLQRSVAIDNKGFLEDRRPAGDCDPYRICARIAQTCK
ncbi:glutamine synthetase 1, mitochondrial-like [Leguminivora glycinivorella]|uniref:glutamine synthetase 1, mitochondrial-like n=1 Tax=Leguminivora glycinivorella TaxID=1035111 RepID=UPI00200C8BFD|nr:glutamine synthetase 1, mitochondrial-like [Leguminivora glycinivorella]